MTTIAAHTTRLLLVDTPETVHPDEPVACFGPEASEFVTEQLLGETVWPEADTADTDRYGRFLRRVWLGLWSACESFGAPPAASGVGTTSDRADEPGSGCDTSYPDVCIRPPPPDLDCGQVEHRRYAVVGADLTASTGTATGSGARAI